MGTKIKRNGVKKIDLRVTFGELLFLNRRASGLGQVDMAKKMNTPLHTYKFMEYDNSIIVKKCRKLLPREECVLLRRRSDMSQEELAKRIGVSRYWLNKMEVGKAQSDRLVEYWKEQ